MEQREEEARRRRATLVLDMRGTLMAEINARQSPEMVDSAVKVEDGSLLVLKRPHVDCFLERMARLFELVAFTSCGQRTADKILDVLDPGGKLFSRRLYAGSCKQFGVKDLSVLGRPLERVVIMDDSYKKCVLNPDNWVPISTFKRMNVDDDRELLGLMPFLEGLAEVEDVRPLIRRTFGDRVEAERLRCPCPCPLPQVEETKRMKGHQVEGSGRINALGRTLTKILRHRAVELGLELRSDGFCKVCDLLRLDIKTRSKVPLSSHSVEEVVQAVEKNSKHRLSLMVDVKDNQMYVRASQGHTINSVASQDLLREVSSADEVPVCVHGTHKAALPSILKEGLKPMGRNHVHFATGLPDDDDGGGATSGIRSTSEVLIFLDVKKAIQDGLKLYISDNHVVLTEAIVPRDCFAKVVEWPSNKLLL